MIYNPRWSSQQKWKWIESCTPHVTFNEDEVFGDQLDSLDKQKTISYWTSDNTEWQKRLKEPSNVTPRHNNQTPQEFEGENQPYQSEEYQPSKIQNKDIPSLLPEVPSISEDN